MSTNHHEPDAIPDHVTALDREWAERQPEVLREVARWLDRNVKCDHGVQGGLRSLSNSDGDADWMKHPKYGWTLALPGAALNRLNRLQYQPVMPPAVDDHRRELVRTARRLWNVVDELKQRLNSKQAHTFVSNLAAEHEACIRHLSKLASAYQNTEGGYYTFEMPRGYQPGAESRNPTGNYAENWSVRHKYARQNLDWPEFEWACEMAKKGTPQVFTNFHIEPLYILRKLDGTHVRLINVKTVQGEIFGQDWRRPGTKPLELTAEYWDSPTHLRRFLAARANGSWSAGEKEMQALSVDLTEYFSYSTVHQVTSWGWHEETGAYFMGDCAIHDGKILKPSRLGTYRINGRKYRMSEKDNEDIEFHHGAPMMNPDETIPPGKIGGLWEELQERLAESIGDNDSMVACGLTVAYAASPEFFKRHAGHPGIWLFGPKGQGKSWIARFLMRFFGFSIVGGVSLESSTGVGTQIVVQQYSGLPVLFDEFQQNTIEQIGKMLKGFFDRVIGAKKLMSGVRHIRTTPIVIGNATATDPPTRSRYYQCQVSVERRKPSPSKSSSTGEWILSPEQAEARKAENFRWLKDNMGRYWWFGRTLLVRRAEYAERVLKYIDEFIDHPGVANVQDDRARYVAAVAWAGFAAACEIFDAGSENWRKSCRAVLRDHLQRVIIGSASQESQQSELSVFWQKLIAAYTRGAFGETKEELSRYFKLIPLEGRAEAKYSEHANPSYPRPPGTPEDSTQRGPWRSTAWTTYLLDINCGPVYNTLLTYVRSQGAMMPLSLVDISNQMKVLPYFVATGGKTRFGGGYGTTRWRINLDRLEVFGYNLVSDAEYADADHNDDPRLGGLYKIVRQLRSDPGSDTEDA